MDIAISPIPAFNPGAAVLVSPLTRSFPLSAGISFSNELSAAMVADTAVGFSRESPAPLGEGTAQPEILSRMPGVFDAAPIAFIRPDEVDPFGAESPRGEIAAAESDANISLAMEQVPPRVAEHPSESPPFGRIISALDEAAMTMGAAASLAELKHNSGDVWQTEKPPSEQELYPAQFAPLPTHDAGDAMPPRIYLASPDAIPLVAEDTNSGKDDSVVQDFQPQREPGAFDENASLTATMRPWQNAENETLSTRLDTHADSRGESSRGPNSTAARGIDPARTRPLTASDVAMLLPQSSAPASNPVPLASAQADPADDIFRMPSTQPQGEEPHTSVPAQPHASTAEQSEAPPKPAPVQNKVLPASVQADTSGLRLAETPSAETRPSAPEEDEVPSLHSSAPVQSTVPRETTQAENDGDEADARSAGAASASTDAAVPVPLRVPAAAEPETIQVPAVAPVRAPVVSIHETTRPAALDDKPSEETPVAPSSESNPIAMRDAFTAWARSRAPGKTEIFASRPARPELDRTEPSASVSARPEAASVMPPPSASRESHNAAGRDAAPLGMRAPVAVEAGTAALSPPAPGHNALPPAEIVAQAASPQPVAAPDTPIALELRVIAGMPYTVQGMDKLALRIAAKSAAGENEFTIRLDPPELGGIEVKLHVDAAGKASASLAADLPPTLDLLQRDSATLERVMKETGLDLSGGLTFSLKGEGESGGRGMQGHAPEKRLQFTTAEDAAANTVAAASGAGEWGVTTRLDISV